MYTHPKSCVFPILFCLTICSFSYGQHIEYNFHGEVSAAANFDFELVGIEPGEDPPFSLTAELTKLGGDVFASTTLNIDADQNGIVFDIYCDAQVFTPDGLAASNAILYVPFALAVPHRFEFTGFADSVVVAPPVVAFKESYLRTEGVQGPVYVVGDSGVLPAVTMANEHVLSILISAHIDPTKSAGPAFAFDNQVGSLVLTPIIVGDVNMDSVVNLLDVQSFVDALVGGEFIPEADINQDGEVNLLDVQLFVDLLTG